MRKRTLTLLALVASLGAVAAQVEFQVYASGEGRYKVLFPGPVKSESFDVKSDTVNVKVTVDSVELRAGTAFLVSYVDASEEVAKAPPGPRFEKVRDAAKAPGGKVLDEKELTIGFEKYPARDVLIENPTTCIRNRIVIAGARLYQVTVQGSRDVVTSASADKFLASFEVTR